MAKPGPHFLIVDDHPLFAEALVAALASGFPEATTVTAASIAEARTHLAAQRADAILLDLRMPNTAGFDGLVELRGTWPRTPIAVVTALSEPDVIRRVRELGANGFIDKGRKRAEIVAVVADLLAGRPSFPELAEGDARPGDDGAMLARLRELTPQQFKVLSLICEGKLNKQIAFALDVAETTVKAHITSIFKKLGIHSRTQAVLAMQRLRLEGLAPGGGFAGAAPDNPPHAR